MNLAILNKTAWHALGRSIGALFVSVYKPYSRGHVRLRSPYAVDCPIVNFELLADERDRLRMRQGLGIILDTLADKDVARVVSTIFMPTRTRLIRSMALPSHTNGITAWLTSLAMDCLPGAERTVLELAGSTIPDRDDPSALDQVVREATKTMFHPTGTCRMGSSDDPSAVLDSTCQVRGTSNLHVVDASVMPTIPRANTFIPVTMIAEKMADTIARMSTGGA